MTNQPKPVETGLPDETQIHRMVCAEWPMLSPDVVKNGAHYKGMLDLRTRAEAVIVGLREELSTKHELACVLQSQVDNADANLEMVRGALKQQIEKLRAEIEELKSTRGEMCRTLEVNIAAARETNIRYRDERDSAVKELSTIKDRLASASEKLPDKIWMQLRVRTFNADCLNGSIGQGFEYGLKEMRELATLALAKVEEERDVEKAKITGIVQVCEKHGWNGVENSKILTAFLDSALQERQQLREEVALLKKQPSLEVAGLKEQLTEQNKEVMALRTQLDTLRTATEKVLRYASHMIDRECKAILEEALNNSPKSEPTPVNVSELQRAVIWLKSRMKEAREEIAVLQKNSHPPADLKPIIEKEVAKQLRQALTQTNDSGGVSIAVSETSSPSAITYFGWECPKCKVGIVDPEILGSPWMCPECENSYLVECAPSAITSSEALDELKEKCPNVEFVEPTGEPQSEPWVKAELRVRSIVAREQLTKNDSWEAFTKAVEEIQTAIRAACEEHHTAKLAEKTETIAGPSTDDPDGVGSGWRKIDFEKDARMECDEFERIPNSGIWINQIGASEIGQLYCLSARTDFKRAYRRRIQAEGAR